MDAWHQIVTFREIYFQMQNINLFVGSSVCNGCTFLSQKWPYYKAWLIKKGLLNLICMLPWMDGENN